MKKMLLALLLLLSFTAVADAKVADNRIAIGGIVPGQTVSDVTAVYGKPVKTDAFKNYLYYKYANNGTAFNVRFDHGRVDYVYVEGNNGITTVDGIKVGSTKEEILKAYGQPDVLRQGGMYKTHPDSQFLQYLAASGRNVALNFEVRYGKVINMDFGVFVRH